MTYDSYVKADSIYKQIENFKKLRRIANEPYRRFILSKKFLWISTYKEDEVVSCDKGLTKLIEKYCDERIKELQEELEKL